MKQLLPILLLLYTSHCYAQTRLEYGDFIQKNNNITWAAETDALLNLMPKMAKYSIKNWYLQKLRNSSINVYKVNPDSYSVTTSNITAAIFNQQNFDTIVSANISNEYFSVIPDSKNVASKYSICVCDSCGRNELFEIFRAKQIVCYGNADLSIKNIFISPLCLKRNTAVGDQEHLPVWDILFNTAFSNGNEIKSKKEDLLYLGEEDYYYDFNEIAFIDNKNKLTPRAPELIKLILEDCKTGKLKIFDPEKGIEIPYKKLNHWGFQKIAVPVYDSTGEVLPSVYIMPERNFDSLYRFKIKQQLFFDKKKEVLISIVKRVDIMEPVVTNSGIYLGNAARFRFYPKNKK